MPDHISVLDYHVIIEPGAIDHLDTIVPPAHAYAIISDSNVAENYGPRVASDLRKKGAKAVLLSFPAGETSKNSRVWEALCNRLSENGLSRDTCIVALGGGVTGDLAGFVAATYMRGVPVIQVPTTLLAMIDASIGGKTGIDTEHGKNLIGAFHQPRVVIIDPNVLRTLSNEELRYGLAEAVKHAAIADAAYLQWMRDSANAIFEHKTDTLVPLIKRSVEIKAKFVNEDVHEAGARAALNFGHTIAHALEQVSGYELAHGFAVALGMVVESAAGEMAGITEPGTTQKIAAALSELRLPTTLETELDIGELLAATRSDKKTRANQQRYTLLARLGSVASNADGEWTTPLSDDVVKEALMRLSAGR
jgi:3-dehydroquinate synthase